MKRLFDAATTDVRMTLKEFDDRKIGVLCEYRDNISRCITNPTLGKANQCAIRLKRDISEREKRSANSKARLLADRFVTNVA